MKILIACEESGVVTEAFRARGHEAYSCDILPTSSPTNKWHLQQDVIPLLNEKWDMIIAFPPCTHLAVSGARYFEQKRKDGRQQEGINFFLRFTELNCQKVAIENPIGIMSTYYRKPDQIIQPWQFGHQARKATCLWLKGLPKLKPTNITNAGEIVISGGKTYSQGASGSWAKDENGKIIAWNDPRTAQIRSKTFKGIAEAMADQWGQNAITAPDAERRGE